MGDLDFDTGSGSITARDTRGRLRGDTGSGSIDVRKYVGEVEADTGSGDVELESVDGEISADTGSGSVTVRNSRSRLIEADTGSGRIELVASSGSLNADTGSGGVEARGFTAGERVRADTGSGGVRFEGDLSAIRDLVIDTGSSGATLRSSKPLRPAARDRHRLGRHQGRYAEHERRLHPDDGEFSATLGKGTGRASIETGSGGTRVEMVR